MTKITTKVVSANKSNTTTKETQQVEKMLTFAEKMQLKREALISKANEIKKTKQVGLSKINFADKYKLGFEILKSSIKGEYIDFKTLHKLVNEYDLKGLSRYVNIKTEKYAENCAINMELGEIKKAEQLPLFHYYNIQLKELFEEKNVERCKNVIAENYSKESREKNGKIKLRTVKRYEAIKKEFERNPEIKEFYSDTKETVKIPMYKLKSFNGEIREYTWNNSFILEAECIELLKVFLYTYGANLKELETE